jgi:hypothetical protein
MCQSQTKFDEVDKGPIEITRSFETDHNEKNQYNTVAMRAMIKGNEIFLVDYEPWYFTNQVAVFGLAL